MVHFTVCSCHVTYVFYNKSTLYSSLNVKDLLPENRRKVGNLSDCTWTRTNKHLLRKRTLNHFAKLTKWLSWVVSTFLYDVLDFMFLSCHVRVSESIHTLQLPEWQGLPCWKQAQSWKFKWLQLDSNPQPLSS